MIRLVRPTLIGWAIAIGWTGLLLGFVAKPAGIAMSSTPSLRQVLSRLGGSGNGATAYLGVAFLIVAVLAGFIAAGQIGAARAEEAEGRLDHLLVRPFSRTAWLTQRLLLAAAALVAAGLLGGAATWIGAAIQRTGVGLGSLLAAGLNVVPPGLCILGIGALAIGVWPRAASIVAYGLFAWSFFVALVGGIVGLNHWVLDTSVFHQMSSAPAVPVNWATDAVLVALSVAAAGIGVAAFRHRDLASD